MNLKNVIKHSLRRIFRGRELRKGDKMSRLRKAINDCKNCDDNESSLDPIGRSVAGSDWSSPC